MATVAPASSFKLMSDRVMTNVRMRKTSAMVVGFVFLIGLVGLIITAVSASKVAKASPVEVQSAHKWLVWGSVLNAVVMVGAAITFWGIMYPKKQAMPSVPLM